MTANEILRITKPELLFEGKDLDSEFKKLALVWHPDKNSDPYATQVFQHISELKRYAEEKLKGGTWNIAGLLKLTALDHTKYEIRYLQEYPFELGVSFIGHNTVTYLIDPGYQDLIKSAKYIIDNQFKFSSDKMEEEFSKYLPQVIKLFSTVDNNVLVFKKDSNEIALRDILAYYNGELNSRHTAWVVSSLYNLLCYLEYAGIVHNGLDMSTYFINPEKHNGALIGGWWYATLEGHEISALPNRTVINDLDLLKSKKARHSTDLELLRSIARELICGKDQLSSVRNSKAPEALIEWACQPASGTAREEYKQWQKVLEKSFGPKKFTKMELTANEVYDK